MFRPFVLVINGMTIFFRAACFVSLGLIVAGLGGCATLNGQLEQAHVKAPLRLLVMPSPTTIDPARLQKVLTPDLKEKLSISENPLAQGVQRAQAYTRAAMDSALAEQTGLIVVTPPTADSRLIDEIQTHDFRATLSQDEADRLQAATGADALLRFRITDYGYTPKSWRTGYITFEVTTTLALAATIAYAGSTVADGAAGAYLAQETAEETAEGYAGFWALDVVSRPVRIEAALIQLKPVATLWKSADTGLSDTRLSRLTRKVGGAERDRQLEQSTDDAVKEIVSALSRALKDI